MQTKRSSDKRIILCCEYKKYNLTLFAYIVPVLCIKPCRYVTYHMWHNIVYVHRKTKWKFGSCSKCFTCSTIDARRPSANPWLSSLVITALPSFMTRRRAYFSWLLSENVDFSPSTVVLLSLRLTLKKIKKKHC